MTPLGLWMVPLVFGVNMSAAALFGPVRWQVRPPWIGLICPAHTELNRDLGIWQPSQHLKPFLVCGRTHYAAEICHSHKAAPVVYMVCSTGGTYIIQQCTLTWPSTWYKGQATFFYCSVIQFSIFAVLHIFETLFPFSWFDNWWFKVIFWNILLVSTVREWV